MIGIVVGSISAYYGGVVDNVIMRIVDVFLTLPFILAALILAAVITPRFGRSLLPAILALVTFGWMGYSRVIRGDILSTKERDYVMAARGIGAGQLRVMARHVFPNALYGLVVVATLYIATAIRTEAGLSFLGLGVPPPTPSWGNILSEGRQYIKCCPWITTFSGLAIMMAVLAFNLMGDALRDLLDPRLRGE